MTYSLLRTFAHDTSRDMPYLLTESRIEDIFHSIESRTTKASTYRENG